MEIWRNKWIYVQKVSFINAYMDHCPSYSIQTFIPPPIQTFAQKTRNITKKLLILPCGIAEFLKGVSKRDQPLININ